MTEAVLRNRKLQCFRQSFWLPFIVWT